MILITILLGTAGRAVGADAVPQVTVGGKHASWAGLLESDRLSILMSVDQLASADSGHFQLTAQSLRLEIDESQVYAAGGSVAPETTSANYTSATIRSTSGRAGQELFVLPQGPAVVTYGCASGTASRFSNLEVYSHVRVSRQIRASVVDDVAVAPCHGAAVSIQGDFLVVFWEWDGELESNEGATSLRTGVLQAAPLEGTPVDSRPTVARARQAYAYATGGVLSLLASPDALTNSFHSAVDLNDVEAVEIHQAAGAVTVSGRTTRLEGATVRLIGHLNGTMLAGGGAIDIAVLSGLEHVEEDGQPVVLSATGVARTWPTLPITWVALATPLALLGGCLVLLYARGRRILAGGSVRKTMAAGHVVSADLALEAGRPRRALWYASLARIWGPVTYESNEMRLAALKDLGRNEEAIALHRELHRQFGGDRFLEFDNAIEAAATACNLGDKEEALRWLHVAEVRDPAQLALALRRSDFDSLASHPWYRSVRADGAATPSYS